jgi:hypothetical protein
MTQTNHRFTHQRHVRQAQRLRRVRAFMKWIEDVLTPYLEQQDEHP